MTKPRWGWPGLPSAVIALAGLLSIFPPTGFGQINALGSQSENFETLAHQATSAREQGQPEQAIHYYQQGLHIRSDWEEGWWYLGTLLYDGNRFADARDAFSKVVELDPKLGPAWSFLGLCEFETKDYSAALANLQQGRERRTENVPEIDKVADYHFALLLIRQGEFERATSLLADEFARGRVTDQIKLAMGLALLRVPLLPEEVDPSQDALVAIAGGIAVLLAQGQRTEAVGAFQQALKDYPDIPELRIAYAASAQPGGGAAPREGANELARTARLFARRTDVGGASETQLKPGPGSSGFDDWAKKAAAARDASNLDDAIRDYRQALQIRADWKEGWWNLSLIYFSSGRYAEAVEPLEHVVALTAGFGTAWALLGLSEYETGNYRNALIHLEKAEGLGIQGSPEAIRIAQYHLAVLLNVNREFEHAVELLASATPQTPLASDWNLALGMALLQVPLMPEQVDPPQRPMLQTAGQVATLLAQSRYDTAFIILQRLLKDYPGTPFLHYVYGSALASLSLYDEADAQLREEIRISPDSALPHLRMAFIALRANRPGDALTAARLAVQLAPRSPEAHYVLGRALLGTGNATQAIEELQAANEMMPNSPEIHFHLARAYAKARQSEKAEQERETFARLNAIADHQRSLRGSQAYGASHEQANDLSLPTTATSGTGSLPQ